MPFLTSLRLYGFAVVGTVCAQQVPGFAASVEFPGISTACKTALNTTVNCASFLPNIAIDVPPPLDSNTTTALCGGSCVNDLRTVRARIASACTASTDKIIFQGAQYPATFIADKYIFAATLACRKDVSSGQYCQNVLNTWPNGTSNACSDCLIGMQQIMLNSSFGYDVDGASQFSQTTSSCQKSTYPWTRPASITSTPTDTFTRPPAPTPICRGTYTVKANDTCYSVSKALNVGTFALLDKNVLNPYCEEPLAVGKSLCLPDTCQLYTLKTTDSCSTILSANPSITLAQLLSWNPNINIACSNLRLFRYYSICLSAPGGTVPEPSVTTDLAVSDAVRPTTRPTNAAPESNPRCGRWYNVEAGDTCDRVSIQMSISSPDFRFLNQGLDAGCSNLLVGVAYCVKEVGNIQTYPGYTNTPGFTIPPHTTRVTTTSTISREPVVVPTQTPLPRASGTITGCFAYRNYVNSTSAEQTKRVNSCVYLASLYNVQPANLTSWNPSLPSGRDCALQPGFSYCVQKTQGGNILPSTPRSCQPLNGTIVSGTSTSCKCYAHARGYDPMTCAEFASTWKTSVSELQRLNTWLSSNCDTALYQNLTTYSSRAICLSNTTGPATTSTTTSRTSSTTTSRPNTTTNPPTTTIQGPTGPTNSGIISSCTQYYKVVSGDGCYAIQQKFGITFYTFWNWNPSIGNDCQYLQLGNSYCVAAPDINSANPAAPTQTGTTTACKRYYTVVQNDSCESIGAEFGATKKQLTTWNPAIRSDCTGLQTGTSICVYA